MCTAKTPRILPPRSPGYSLRVNRYFPHVKDFTRDERGDLVWESLKGPEQIEVRGGDGYDL